MSPDPLLAGGVWARDYWAKARSSPFTLPHLYSPIYVGANMVLCLTHTRERVEPEHKTQVKTHVKVHVGSTCVELDES